MRCPRMRVGAESVWHSLSWLGSLGHGADQAAERLGGTGNGCRELLPETHRCQGLGWGACTLSSATSPSCPNPPVSCITEVASLVSSCAKYCESSGSPEQGTLLRPGAALATWPSLSISAGTRPPPHLLQVPQEARPGCQGKQDCQAHWSAQS